MGSFTTSTTPYQPSFFAIQSTLAPTPGVLGATSIVSLQAPAQTGENWIFCDWDYDNSGTISPEAMFATLLFSTKSGGNIVGFPVGFGPPFAYSSTGINDSPSRIPKGFVYLGSPTAQLVDNSSADPTPTFQPQMAFSYFYTFANQIMHINVVRGLKINFDFDVVTLQAQWWLVNHVSVNSFITLSLGVQSF